MAETNCSTDAPKRLWDVKHSYYCTKGNFFSNECHEHFRSFPDFLASEGDADLDLNMVYRWDWKEGEDNDALEYTGDDNYRNGILTLFYMGQRKALARSVSVDVCRADEPAVREFLAPRLEYLRELWSPLSDHWEAA